MESLQFLAKVGWQLSRIKCKTMWWDSVASYYAGWPAEQMRSSIDGVKGVSYACWHKLWHEAMTLVGDLDEAFS